MNEVKLQRNLNFLLKGQGRSLSKLASLSGMNKSTLHGYSNGVLPKSLLSLVTLAHNLGVSPADLLFGEVQKGNLNPTQPIIGGKFELILRPLRESEVE